MFETLMGAVRRGELMLVEGGFCHYHLRRNGQLTIYEIIATRKGAGSEMLARLKQVPRARTILAKCPVWLEANGWYRRMGFQELLIEHTRSGKPMRVWMLTL